MLTKGLGEEIRAMKPGDTIARVRRAPLASWQGGDEDRVDFNRYVSSQRARTGFPLVVETLAPQVVGDHVLRVYAVTRTEDVV